MRQYVILIEKGEGNFGAFAPSLPGCVSVGKTRQEAIDNIHEAIQFHLDSMAQHGSGWRPYPRRGLGSCDVGCP